ncbi:hypothetical protein [Maribacter sp. HTCC2170]|uniref:hypothetical protein n=1 Tax=Maribacter sp. (strain HTCC2170 / KCCM 42371) TaxID=313603 RepID=UPI00006B49A0|nr:hypothetical protein [Maribacter sp. HTCC2170]EAR01081.1 hypothetical protein FB2170_09926 [Maribacter sp. HTCC2170]
MRYLFIFILLILNSCKGQKEVTTNKEKSVGENDDRITLLVQDNYSGSDIPESIIIKDAKSLKSFYSKINRTRKPGLPVPEIDFTQEMILVYSSGKMTSNKKMELTFKDETIDQLVLEIEIKKLDVDSNTFINPFGVYKLPLIKKKIIVKSFK